MNQSREYLIVVRYGSRKEPAEYTEAAPNYVMARKRAEAISINGFWANPLEYIAPSRLLTVSLAENLGD